MPLLDILGFSAFDQNKVRAEYQADFPGAKSGERVDYALFCNGAPVMFIEAKSYTENLSNHCPQLSRYFNATPENLLRVAWLVIDSYRFCCDDENFKRKPK